MVALIKLYGFLQTISALQLQIEIITPLSGRKVRYVASDELTCTEVAAILGAAIGKPDFEMGNYFGRTNTK